MGSNNLGERLGVPCTEFLPGELRVGPTPDLSLEDPPVLCTPQAAC